MNSSFELIIGVLAVASIVFGFSGPRVIKRMAERSSKAGLRTTPEKQWMARNVLSMACFVSCMLYGVVLHFTGVSISLVEALLAAGMVSLIVWKPEPPPGVEEAAIHPD